MAAPSQPLALSAGPKGKRKHRKGECKGESKKSDVPSQGSGDKKEIEYIMRSGEEVQKFFHPKFKSQSFCFREKGAKYRANIFARVCGQQRLSTVCASTARLLDLPFLSMIIPRLPWNLGQHGRLRPRGDVLFVKSSSSYRRILLVALAVGHESEIVAALSQERSVVEGTSIFEVAYTNTLHTTVFLC